MGFFDNAKDIEFKKGQEAAKADKGNILSEIAGDLGNMFPWTSDSFAAGYNSVAKDPNYRGESNRQNNANTQQAPHSTDTKEGNTSSPDSSHNDSSHNSGSDYPDPPPRQYNKQIHENYPQEEKPPGLLSTLLTLGAGIALLKMFGHYCYESQQIPLPLPPMPQPQPVRTSRYSCTTTYSTRRNEVEITGYGKTEEEAEQRCDKIYIEDTGHSMLTNREWIEKRGYVPAYVSRPKGQRHRKKNFKKTARDIHKK